MPIYIEESKVNKIYLDESPVKRVYYGTTEVWSRSRLATVSGNGSITIPDAIRSEANPFIAYGKSMKVNQLFFESLVNGGGTDRGFTTKGITVKCFGNHITMQGILEDVEDKNLYIGGLRLNLIIGHKYCFLGDGDKFSIGAYSGLTITYISRIATATSTQASIYACQNTGSSLTTINESFDTFIVDLTEIFGVGDEPSSVDDSRMDGVKAYLAEHPEYNAGSIINSNPIWIASRSHDMIDLSDQELYGIGEAKDTFNNVTGILTRKIGSVNLSTLHWTFSTSYLCWSTIDLDNIMVFPSSATEKATILCDKALIYTRTDFLGDTQLIGISTSVSGGTNKRIYFRNGSSSDKPIGTLYYELVNPTEIQLEPQPIRLFKGTNVISQEAGDVPFSEASLTYSQRY